MRGGVCEGCGADLLLSSPAGKSHIEVSVMNEYKHGWQHVFHWDMPHIELCEMGLTCLQIKARGDRLLGQYHTRVGERCRKQGQAPLPHGVLPHSLF